MTKRLAYILGVMASDGCNSYKGKNNAISLHSIDKDFVDNFKNKMEKEFKVKMKTGTIPPTKKEHNLVYYAISYNKKISEKIGSFYGEDWHITISKKYPKILTEKYFFDFLNGFFDGDGSICNPSDRYRLRLHIGYNDPAFFLKEQLEFFGFKFTLDYRRDRDYKIAKELILVQYEEIKKFSEKIKSSIPRKEKRLKRYRKSEIVCPSYYKDLDVVFEKVLKLRDQTKFGARKLAKHNELIEYNIPITTIRNWIYKRKKPTIKYNSQNKDIYIKI